MDNNIIAPPEDPVETIVMEAADDGERNIVLPDELQFVESARGNTNDSYYFSTDDDGYVTTVSTVGDGGCLDSVDDFDFSGERLRFHKWNGAALEFDSDAYNLYLSSLESADDVIMVSQLDRIEAQVTYTALKTGTLIGE